MTILRRTFLRDVCRSTFAASFLLASARKGLGQTISRSDVPAEAQQDPVFLFTAATFAPYVGDIFEARMPAVKASHYVWTRLTNMKLKTA